MKMNIEMDKSERNYTVYMHINKINNKKYIGITSKEPKKRWNNGWGYQNQPFFNAIKKYGWENFDHEIIADSLSLEEALELENEKILEYDSIINHNGYNIVYYDKKQLTYYRKNNVPVYQFDIYGNYIREYDSLTSASSFNNIEIPLIIQACKNEPYYSKGYVWRYKKDISDINIFLSTFNFRVLSHYYPIYQFDINGNYIQSFENAAAATKYNSSWLSTSILKCCEGKHRHAANYVWRFQIDVPNIEEFSNNYVFPELIKSRPDNPVLQFDFDGNYIKTYKNCEEAALSVECCRQLISYACIQRIQYAKGYLWRYEKDYHGEKLQYIPPNPPGAKTVYQFDLNFNYINSYKSATEASKKLNISRKGINACCNGNRNTAGGYIWSYNKIPDYSINIKKDKKISQYTKDGIFIKTFNNINEIKELYNFNIDAIKHCCIGISKTSYGYVWKYENVG